MPVKLPITDPVTADILKILTSQSPTIHAYSGKGVGDK
jgi:hypothetical protein